MLTVSMMTPVFGRQSKQPLEMRVLFKPGPVQISGKPTVYYELFLTSRSNDTVRLQKLAVFDNNRLVRTVEHEKLPARYSRKGREDPACILPPGSTGVIYLEMTLPNNTSREFSHELVVETIHNKAVQSRSIKGGVTVINNQPALIVGAPLRAGDWAAVYEPSWTRGHRRVVYLIDEKYRIPGRFAIDFIQLDSVGKYASGDGNEIKNWYGYGTDVLAVADGVVAVARDDFKESETLSGHPDYTYDKATGNYVSINIGNGHLVFYEHLKPGSIRVKAGQRVKKGTVIASLGFTGQTTGPHLHFHISNANSPLGAEGIPFAFERFTLTGTYPDFAQFGKAPWAPAGNTLLTGERPAPNTVIRFQP